jgi:hypothetical protein
MSNAIITEVALGADDTNWHYYRCIVEKIGTVRYNRLKIDDLVEQVIECDDAPTVEYTTNATI